jgi:DNA-binding MarR family transcriptional regulator
MAKGDSGETLSRLQVVAREARTDLAARLLKHGFYAGQDRIMLALSREDGMTAGELARYAGVRPPTIAKMISRLAAQGFVTRSVSESDARLAHIHLTEAGRNAVSEIRTAIAKTEKVLLKVLGKKDRKLFHKLLGELEVSLASRGGNQG